ncbi:MAG TPA: MFS transporter [Acetobacteraceae bacterium]|nr:MFS transporter [Acetobacteraceae bacterium]
MNGQTSESLLSLFDSAKLTPRYWFTFGLLALITVLEFFDFLVVGFLVAVLGPQWHLTYGQSAVILYSGGVGAIAGAIIWGALADAWGRKTQLVLGTFICGIGAGGLAFVPDGGWQVFAALRFVVGFGLTAAVTPCLTIVVEQAPTRWRTSLSSFYVVFATAGTLVASATSATLLHALGWRGVAMLGALTIPVGLAIAVFVPESVRWLTAKGHFAQARALVASRLGLPLERVPLPTMPPVVQPSGSLTELYSSPRRFWETVIIWGGSSTAAYGVYLWGPTIVALLLHISVPQAAKYFVFVAATGVVGKILVTFISPLMGRRLCGIVFGFGAAVALAAAAWFNQVFIGGVPLLVVLMCCSTFGIDGGFSNLAPYTVELFGVRMGARSSGLGQAANGVGKILGPLSLALIAGTGNFISPKATADAVLPAFLFLAFGMLLVGLSFAVLGVETHGRAMLVDEAEAESATGRAATGRTVEA